MPRYRLLHGMHSEKGSDGHPHIYNAGDVFESVTENMHKRWSEKFMLSEESSTVTLEGTRMQAVEPASAPGRWRLHEHPCPGDNPPPRPEVGLKEKVLHKEQDENPVSDIPVEQHKSDSSQQVYVDTLREMTIPELRKHAEDEEISLEGISKKEDIINRIMQHKST